MRPKQDVMNRIKEAFEILKAPCYRTSMIVTRGSKCGPNPWQQDHHKARDALRSATKGGRAFTSIWDRWQNYEIYRKSQLAHNWSDAWVRYLDHIVHFNIYHNATQPQREGYVKLLHLRTVDENKQAWQRPGYREAKKELSNLQKSKREEQVLYIQVSDRKSLQNRIDPSLQEYLDWLSTDWAEQFAEPQNSERPQTSSFSSWSPSPTWWSSSSWTQSWQKWHPPQVARRQMVRTMVNETTSNSRSQRSRNSIQEIGATRLKTTSLTLSPSTSKSDCSLFFSIFPLQKLLNLSFALSQQQQPWVRWEV